MPRGIPNRPSEEAAPPDLLKPEEIDAVEEDDSDLDIPKSKEELERDAHKKPIEDAPKNGQVIVLYSEYLPNGIRGYWRETRHQKGMRWVPTACWADPLTKKPLGEVEWTHWSPER
jgi:hypothetical protein